MLIMEPAYPAYVDANVMAGKKIYHLPTSSDEGFLPTPRAGFRAAARVVGA